MDNAPLMVTNSTPRNLSRIRTTQHPHTSIAQNQTHQSQQLKKSRPTRRGAYGGRGGRGGVPNRAVAESEHTVVRGSKNGKQISTMVIHHQYDPPESSQRAGIDYELLGNPPDLARVFVNRTDHADDAIMSDNAGQLGQGVSNL